MVTVLIGGYLYIFHSIFKNYIAMILKKYHILQIGKYGYIFVYTCEDYCRIRSQKCWEKCIQL